MKFNILKGAIVVISILLASCNSSNSTEGNSDSEIDLAGIGDFKGIANGTITIGGKTLPIEFNADAYAKQVSLKGFTDLAKRETGWSLFISAKTTTTSPQDIEEGRNQTVLGYHLSWDSTQCVYNAKVGTVTVESFIAKKSGTKNYFTVTGKVSFTATNSVFSDGSSDLCPDLSVQATFTKINVHDSGLN